MLGKGVVRALLMGSSSSDFVIWMLVHEQGQLLTLERNHSEARACQEQPAWSPVHPP